LRSLKKSKQRLTVFQKVDGISSKVERQDVEIRVIKGAKQA